MLCSACGEPQEAGVGFCTNCGTPTAAASAAAPPPPPAPQDPPPAPHEQPPAPPEGQESITASADPYPTAPQTDAVPPAPQTDAVPAAPAQFDAVSRQPQSEPEAGHNPQPAGHSGPQESAKAPSKSRRTPLTIAGAVILVAALAAGVYVWGPWKDQDDAEAAPPSSSASPSASSSASASASSSATPSATRSGSASASPSARSSASAKAAASIPLSGFEPSTSEVRDGMVVYRTSNGVSAHVPGESIARTYPMPAAPSGQEVAGSTLDVIGTGEAPKLAALVEIRTPASGLDPEQYTTVLRTYDEKKTAPLVEAPVTGIEHDNFRELTLHGSSDGSIALESENYSEPSVRFFNPALEQVGEGSGVFTAHHGTTAILSDRDDDCLISAWSTTTGAKLWENNYGTVTYPSCSATLDAGGLTVAVNGNEDFVAVVDPATGVLRNQLTGAQSVKFDSAGPLAVVEYGSSDATLPALRVYDTTTWASTLEVTSEQGKALNLQTLYLFGSKLYIENTDEQPVLDAMTGEKLAADWKLRPAQAVSADWTLVTDETEGTYSLEANDNGVYPGPWW